MKETKTMFKSKHIGSLDHINTILSSMGFKTLDLFIDNIIPEAIKSNAKIDTPNAITEQKMLERLYKLSKQNLQHMGVQLTGVGLKYSHRSN